MHALITNESYQAALACIQSLGRAGHEVSVIATEKPSPASSSKYVTRRLTQRLLRDDLDARVDVLVGLVQREGIDVVIPLSDRSARVAAAAHARLPDAKAFVASSVESVETAGDKISARALAQSIGIPVAQGEVFDGGAGIIRAIETLGLPCVVKVPVSTAGQGTFVVRTKEEIERIASRLPAGRILVEGFIDGVRVDVTGFADNGRLLEWFGFKHVPGFDAKGTPPYALSDTDKKLGVVLAKVCKALRWRGGIDLDLMRDRHGVLFLLEINSRFSGTLVFADNLGVDLPRYYVEAASGVSFHRPARRPPSDILFASVFPAEVALIASNPVIWRKRAAELRARYRFVENVYPDDPPLTQAQMRLANEIARRTSNRLLERP